MQERLCVIFDYDEEYAYKLMKSFLQQKNKLFKVMVFTKEEELIQFVQQNYIYLMIADEDILISTVWSVFLYNKEYVQKILILSSDRNSNNKDNEIEGCRQIFKYQPIDIICNEIMVLCGKDESELNGFMNMIGVYSPINCAYKTAFSIALANALGEKGKVLYINLEEYSGLEEVLKYTDGNLSDAIYYYQIDNNNIKKISDMIVQDEQFDYIAPSDCFEDLSYLTADQWLEFFKRVSKIKDYVYIVVDISNGINRAWKLAECCKRIYMPIKTDYLSTKKVNSFEKYCLCMGKEDILEKTEKIVVPYDENIHMSNCFIRQLEYSVLGNFARGLVENELYC